MADQKDPRIVTEKKIKQEPTTVREHKTVSEPRTVMEKKTIEVPKTVMEERTVEEEKTVMEEKVYQRLVSASCKELDGWEVVNAAGEKLGKFDDVMLDMRSGRIAYAVINIGGGFLGMNNKMVAVPWNALSMETGEYAEGEDIPERMILNVSKDKLENAPEYSAGEWPRSLDRSWLNDNLYSRYGYTPYWEQRTMKRGEHYSSDPRSNY